MRIERTYVGNTQARLTCTADSGDQSVGGKVKACVPTPRPGTIPRRGDGVFVTAREGGVERLLARREALTGLAAPDLELRLRRPLTHNSGCQNHSCCFLDLLLPHTPSI